MDALWVLPGTLLWLGLLLPPWRPWGNREQLEAHVSPPEDLSDVAALIPARNEAHAIGPTLRALAAQGRHLKIVVVDDQSSDGTAEIARATDVAGLRLVGGQTLPAGWSGKLWALEQGRCELDRPLTLLLDADIELAPGLLSALRRKLRDEGLQLVSLMAALRMQAFWERLLLPAFVFFFRLLYPFRLANDPAWPRVAAAAGGCVLLETRLLADIGGFAALRAELIDDCALARRVKAQGARTWIGVTHDVRSLRPYPRLGSIWAMVARTAFTQLRYSLIWLLVCTAVFAAAFWLPPALLVVGDGPARALAALALAAMVASYVPTLHFYRLSALWALALPVTATLYLAMTWDSARRYWAGERSRWKDRVYARPGAGERL